MKEIRTESRNWSICWAGMANPHRFRRLFWVEPVHPSRKWGGQDWSTTWTWLSELYKLKYYLTAPFFPSPSFNFP